MSSIRVATVQFQHKASDKSYNMACIENYAKEAAENNVDIILFPEMCITGYWHVRNLSRDDIEVLAESIPDGPSCHLLRRWAEQYQITISAGLIEKNQDDKLYNTQVIAFPDGRIERHRKLHCFISEHMDSGNEYTVVEHPSGVKLGVLICYDNNIIENVRITALKGADILLSPHQTGGCDSRSPYAMGLIDPLLWENRKHDPDAIKKEFASDKGLGWILRWLPARAHDNGMFVVFSNGVGLDDDEVRTGNAMILDPYGRILEVTTEPCDLMLIHDLDLSLLDYCTGRRWIRARRPDLYGDLISSSGNELDPRTARFSK